VISIGAGVGVLVMGVFCARLAWSAWRRYSDLGTLMEVADRWKAGLGSGVAGLKV
jgi:hypothetical protein